MTTLSNVLAYRAPKAREETTAWMGMVIFLASWGMMFAALLFAYGMVRSRATAWPPPLAPRLPILLPLINTLVVAASSVALQFALVSIRNAQTRVAGRAIGATTILGMLFLGMQIQLWLSLLSAGLRLDGGAYPSVFYTLTVFHGLHVLVGLVALSALTYKTLSGAFNAARHLPIRLWTLYWHFVAVVWLILFVTVYVL